VIASTAARLQPVRSMEGGPAAVGSSSRLHERPDARTEAGSHRRKDDAMTITLRDPTDHRFSPSTGPSSDVAA
jgi:hypothetical protein